MVRSGVGRVTEIRLAARPGNRALAAIGASLLALALVMWAAILVAAVASAEGFSWLRIGGIAVALLLAGTTWIAFSRLLRETFVRRPRVVIESGRLVVHHHVYLRKPYPIDRDDIEAASVRRAGESWWGDEAPAVVRELVTHDWRDHSDLDDLGDLDEVEPDDDPGFLDERTSEMLPAVTHDPKEGPNVALHLRCPTELDDYRRVGLNRTIRGKPWPETSSKRGLLLAVHDLDQLEAALAAWGVLRKFGLRQAELVEPPPPDPKRARRELIGAVLFLAYGVALFVRWIASLFD